MQALAGSPDDTKENKISAIEYFRTVLFQTPSYTTTKCLFLTRGIRWLLFLCFGQELVFFLTILQTQLVNCVDNLASFVVLEWKPPFSLQRRWGDDRYTLTKNSKLHHTNQYWSPQSSLNTYIFPGSKEFIVFFRGSIPTKKSHQNIISKLSYNK